jgi:hypothetical protein
MMATVDLVGIRPLMQATLAALFKFEILCRFYVHLPLTSHFSERRPMPMLLTTRRCPP